MQNFKDLLLENKLVDENDLHRSVYYLPDSLCKELADYWKSDNVENILIPMMWPGNLARHIDYGLVEGYELYPEISEIAASVSSAKVINKNFLEEDILKKYDLIIWSMPLGMRFSGDNVKETEEWFKLRKSEEAYIYKSLKLLSDNWSLIFIVPNWFLFNRSLLQFRNYITENYNLSSIIEFEGWRNWPFYPYAWVSTSLIKITNRTPSSKVYLDMCDWKDFVKKISERSAYNLVDVVELKETWSVWYHLFDNSILENELVDYETTTIWDVAEVFTWRPPSIDNRSDAWWEYIMIMPKNIQWEIIVPVQWQKYTNTSEWMRVIEEWDILISNFWPDFRTAIVKEKDIKYLAHPNIIVIRDKTNYLKLFYDSDLWDKIFNSYLRKYSAWTIVKRISVRDLCKFKIPKLEITYNDLTTDTEQVMITQLKKSAEDKWRIVNAEYRLSDTKIADFTLEYQWKIQAIVEVKRKIKDKKMLINQVEYLLNWTDIKDAFVLDQNSFYYFDVEKKWLKEINGFPDPKEWVLWQSNHSYETNWHDKTWETQSKNTKYDSKLDMLLKIAARVDGNVIENIAITKSVQSDVLELKSMIKDSLDKINGIKNKEFDLEWKLLLIQDEVWKIWETLKQQDFDWYSQHELLLKNKILNWDILHDLSKEYLPVWSFLFHELSKIEWIDFSPVVQWS